MGYSEGPVDQTDKREHSENLCQQIFIAYDKQDDCRPATKKILEENAVICLSNDGNELYGRSWNKEVNENEDEL